MKQSGPFLLFFISLFFISVVTYAQPDLPAIGAISDKGINVLSWNNPYEQGLQSIAVQRSADSNLNFVTIGYVPNLKKGVQNFVDAHPMPGNNWYRLIIMFSSDMEWKSNLAKLHVDSAAIASRGQLPPSDSLQKLINQMGDANAVSNLNTVSYPKSRYVFTNPFTGNINIEIEDALKNTYSIIFYDQQERAILNIPRVGEKTVILDKRNFQRTGMYRFKVFRNKEEFDKGYITVY